MTTRPPVSTPVDHARWKQQAEIENHLRGDSTRITIRDHMLDNRWAVIFGSSLWGVLMLVQMYQLGQIGSIGDKIDRQNEKLTSQTEKIIEYGASQKVLEGKVTLLEATLNQSIESHNQRLMRLEKLP